MSTYIKANADLCVGCHTCELACALEHSEYDSIGQLVLNGATPGYRIKIVTKKGKARPSTCRQCKKPACVEACPEGAISRLAEGKPVLVDDDKCTGCGKCVEACPFDMMFMKPEAELAIKCDLCIRRQAAGQDPACIESCPTSALKFSDDKVPVKAK